MQKLLIDFETQAMVGINNPLYTCSIDTKIICMSWGFMGGSAALWWAGQPIPDEIIRHVKSKGLIGASNASFDRKVWKNIGVRDHGFPETDDDQWFCTQAQSRVAGLPSALDKSAKALQLTARKSRRGNELIKKCSIPPFSENPQDYADLGAYCLQDWVVMDKVARSIPFLNAVQEDDYLLNETINSRGIKIDRELAEAAKNYAEVERGEISDQLVLATSGAVKKPTQSSRFRLWLVERLEKTNSSAVGLMKKQVNGQEKWCADKNVRTNLLSGHGIDYTLSDDVLRALQLMNDAGGSAVAKYGKMAVLAHPDDDRVRGCLRFAGAPSTLRFSSMGLQVHNLKRDAFSSEEAEFYRSQMLRGSDLVDQNGDPVSVMETLGKLLRSAIIPKKNHVFIVGDWNAVESRMTAYLAGDTDKLTMFERGECPYCYAATSFYGRPINKKEHSDERQVGKVIDLACGFLGGPGALASMATSLRIHIDPDRRQEMVDAWRANHPLIVKYGDALLKAATKAVAHPHSYQHAGSIKYYFSAEESALYCDLPGEVNSLRYADCRLEKRPLPWDKTKMRPQLTALKAALNPAFDAIEWPRHSLWRGLLLENVVQAVCAQILRAAVKKCEKNSLDVIFHTHDEIIVEVPLERADDARTQLQLIMETTPQYLTGLALKSTPKVMVRYGK